MNLLFNPSVKLEKSLFLTLILLSLFFTTSCQGPKKWASRLDSTIYQSWKHAFEEDTKTEKVYRPAGYTLPPARGREGIEFRQGGSVIYTAIGPADVPVRHEGSWTMTSKNTMLIRLPDYVQESMSFQIISVDKERLVIAN